MTIDDERRAILSQVAAGHLDPTRAVVTSCLEPVFAIMFSVLFVGETLGILQVAGIVAVLTATVMVQKQ